MRVDQQISSATVYKQTGRLIIQVQRETYIATGSGKLDPQMKAVPQIAVRLVTSPAGAKPEGIMIRPGTGTIYDFNITMKSMVYGNYLQLGEYQFEYTAESTEIVEQGGGSNKTSVEASGT